MKICEKEKNLTQEITIVETADCCYLKEKKVNSFLAVNLKKCEYLLGNGTTSLD